MAVITIPFDYDLQRDGGSVVRHPKLAAPAARRHEVEPSVAWVSLVRALRLRMVGVYLTKLQSPYI